MTWPLFSLLIACVLPIVCAGIAKWGTFSTPRSQGGYDNRQPRAWLSAQSGWRARANAAQANSFEALPLYIAGVFAALHRHADPAWINALCAGFIALRLAYIGLYVADRAGARSVVWVLGFACGAALFVAPRG